MSQHQAASEEVLTMFETPWYQWGPAGDDWRLGTEPAGATAIGSPDDEPMAIYLGSRAMELINRRMEEDPDTPFAGLLLGYPLAGRNRRFVLVTDVLVFPVSLDDGDVRLTPYLFEQLEPVWRSRGDRAYVVGWCHAGPKRGIALSSFHRFNHHRYFPRPWQVALIIDTSRHASLLYRWQGEALVPCDDFYYWNMEQEPVVSLLEPPGHVEAGFVQVAASSPEERPTDRPARPRWTWLLAVLVGYALIPQAPGSIMWVRHQLTAESRRLEELRADLTALESEGQRLQQEVQATAGAPAPPASPGAEAVSTGPSASEAPAPAESTGPPFTAAGRPAAVAANPAFVTGEIPALSAIESDDDSTPATGEASPPSGGRDYVIKPGDTMWSISRTLLGDPWAFRRLAQTNQIEDPDIIFPGQRLTLPDE